MKNERCLNGNGSTPWERIHPNEKLENKTKKFKKLQMVQTMMK